MQLQNRKVDIRIIITDTLIKYQDYQAIFPENTGAVVEFKGIVRGSEEGAPIDGIHYESYEGMAVKKMEQILNALANRISVIGALVVHRTGWVPVGEASLYICINSEHRKEALQFCDEFIDELKKDVPIWKAAFEKQ
jgi:molybdopterin synthase catalytic subunit